MKKCLHWCPNLNQARLFMFLTMLNSKYGFNKELGRTGHLEDAAAVKVGSATRSKQEKTRDASTAQTLTMISAEPCFVALGFPLSLVL